MSVALVSNLDAVAFGVGLIGFVAFIMGIAFISWQIALIVGGFILMMWSFLVARALSARGIRKGP